MRKLHMERSRISSAHIEGTARSGVSAPSRRELSIIIPTLNGAKTVEACFESICRQTFRDFEVIVVDGGSTDGTLEKVQAYSAALPSLEILHCGEAGVYPAMNLGVRAATGAWIYFLGADDRFEDPNVLAEVTARFNPSVDVIYGNVSSERLGPAYAGVFSLDKLLRQNICHQAVFVRRTVFEQVGLFNTRYTLHADWDHNLRWALDPRVRAIYLPRTIARYADHGISSIAVDERFARDRRWRCIRCGWRNLPSRKALALLRDELKQTSARRDFSGIARAYSLAPVIWIAYMMRRTGLMHEPRDTTGAPISSSEAEPSNSISRKLR